MTGGFAAIAWPAAFDVHAQTFPVKPIILICPWPAGGSTDAVIRAVLGRLRREEHLRPGARVVLEEIRAQVRRMIDEGELLKVSATARRAG